MRRRWRPNPRADGQHQAPAGRPQARLHGGGRLIGAPVPTIPGLPAQQGEGIRTGILLRNKSKNRVTLNKEPEPLEVSSTPFPAIALQQNQENSAEFSRAYTRWLLSLFPSQKIAFSL